MRHRHQNKLSLPTEEEFGDGEETGKILPSPFKNGVLKRLAPLVFRTRRQRDSRMLILRSPLYPSGACVASVARLAISPGLANLANFGPPPANFIFNFLVYPAIF